MRFAAVIERAPDGSYGAYSPDVLGVGVGADSPEEAKRKLAEAIAFHFEGAKPPTSPRTTVDYVEASV